jgi:hypothetical protein
MSSKSITRSKKKRSNNQNSTRVKTLHQLLWLSGALQASGLLSHDKPKMISLGNYNRTRTFNSKYDPKSGTSIIDKIASMKKFGQFDGVGPYLYGRVKKERKKPWEPAEPKRMNLSELPPAPPTQLPTINELKALEEQLQNELNKQTRRNQRMSVSRRANRSLRSVKRSLRNSTRNAKSRSMYRQSHH